MDNIENNCINLFKIMHLEDIGKGNDYDYYFSLLNEFFRRATIFSQENDIHEPGPWQVIKPILQQNCYLSTEAESVIESFAKVRGVGQGIYIYLSLANFTLFEKARNAGIIGSKEKNIYSPLLKMYESKGEFHNHHGFIEFGDLSQISIRNNEWMTTRKEPYVEFDEYF